MKRVIVYVVLVIVSYSSVSFAQETIKIGVILHLSGRLAAFGEVSRQGIEIALEELNASGGIQGSPVKAAFADSEGDPAKAIRVFRSMVKEDNVKVIVGVMTDEVAIALSEEADSLQIPLIVTGAHTQVITGEKCNRYTFRLCPSAYQLAKAGAILAAGTKAQKWVAIGTDRAGSREIWDFVARFLTEANPDISFDRRKSVILAPDTTDDWSVYIRQIEALGAEGIIVYLPSGDFIDFIKQARLAGLFSGERQMVTMMGGLSELLSLGTAMPAGVWWASPYWYQASRSPLNQQFTKSYESAFTVPPSWQAQFGYGALISYAKAAEKSGSTDPEKIVSALEGLTLELPVGKVLIRAEDHQAIMHLMAGKTARISVTSRKKSFRGMGTMILFRSKEISEPLTESGCTMQ